MAGAADVAAVIPPPSSAPARRAWKGSCPTRGGAELAKTAVGVDHLTITVSASEAYGAAKNVHMTGHRVAASAGLDNAIPGPPLPMPCSTSRHPPSPSAPRSTDEEDHAPTTVAEDRPQRADAAAVSTRAHAGRHHRRGDTAPLSARCSTPVRHRRRPAPPRHPSHRPAQRVDCPIAAPAWARFDTAVGGLGGSPFAPAVGGNLATEDLLHLLDDAGVETGVDLAAVLAIGRVSPTWSAMASRAVSPRQWDRERTAVDAAARRLDGDCRGTLRHRARVRRPLPARPPPPVE